MPKLETKIPPPLVLVIFLFICWLLRGVEPTIEIGNTPRNAILAGSFIIGLGIDIIAFREFRKFHTTINPMAPQDAKQIVTSGFYSKTRNPMYLASAILLFGWAIYNGSLVGFLTVPFFVLYLNHFQIIPEERALSAKFGQEYLDYLQKVRRWI